MAEWNAARYARISQLQKAMADEALALLTLTGSERVLDVGCGDGKITAEIATRVPRGSVVGVDPSHDMIAFATAHFGSAGAGNLRFEVADARSLPFRDAFDVVVSFNALHWVPEQRTALASIRATLEHGGRVLARVVIKGTRTSLEEIVEETRKSAQWSRFFVDFSDPYLRLTAEQYTTLAIDVGFRVRSVQTHDKVWDFESRDAFRAFCAVGLVAWTRRLPDDAVAPFVDDVLERYRAVVDDDATFRFYQMDVVLDRR